MHVRMCVCVGGGGMCVGGGRGDGCYETELEFSMIFSVMSENHEKLLSLHGLISIFILLAILLAMANLCRFGKHFNTGFSP